MAEYIYISINGREKLGISTQVYDQIVKKAVASVPGLGDSGASLKKGQRAGVKKVKCTIRKGIVHIWISVDVKKNSNIQEVSMKIQENVANAIQEATGHIPFDIQVKVESII